MSVSRAQIVAEARSWIGTPYRHQASCKGAGTDCLGLIRGVWRALYGEEPALPPAYTRDWSEVSGDEALWTAAEAHLLPVARKRAVAPGEVILFRMREGAVAKHLGILSDPPTCFIHAYSDKHVAENALSTPWARRIVARFDFPEIGDI